MSIQVLPESNYFPDHHARIRVSREIRQKPIRRHRHEFRELVFILSGEALHNQDGRWHRIGRGHVLFIGEKSFHGYKETRQLNLANVLINRPACERMERDLAELPGYHELFSDAPGNASRPLRQLVLNDADLEQVSEWIERIEREASSHSGEGMLVAEAYLTLVIALLLRRRETEEPAKPRHDNFTTLMSWIDAHLDAPISIPALARRAGLSERSFYRKFRQLTGTSPADYVLKARLRKAATLLGKASSQASCREIANRCGFHDPNYFSTRFKLAYGQSPARFRGHRPVSLRENGAHPRLHSMALRAGDL